MERRSSALHHVSEKYPEMLELRHRDNARGAASLTALHAPGGLWRHHPAIWGDALIPKHHRSHRLLIRRQLATLVE